MLDMIREHGLPDPSGTADPTAARCPDAPSVQEIVARDLIAPPAVLVFEQPAALGTAPIAVDRYPSSRYALVELSPLTGRRHQLRRHMKHIAHPIIGDATHGKGVHNRMFAEHFGSQRMLLACMEMQITHPLTGAAITLTCPLAEDFASVVRALGWEHALPANSLPAV